MQGIRLNEYAAQIQLAEQLPEHRPLVVFAGGVTSLAVAIRLLRSSWPHPRRRSSA